MTIFLSYAHQDAPKIDVLSRDLDDLVGTVWLDKSLSGGQLWWDEILRQIRECRLFVLAVSRHSLRSEACLAESAYATALDRPFLVGPRRRCRPRRRPGRDPPAPADRLPEPRTSRASRCSPGR